MAVIIWGSLNDDIKETQKEIERLKKHIAFGHKGSPLEKRDYEAELKASEFHLKQLIMTRLEASSYEM